MASLCDFITEEKTGNDSVSKQVLGVDYELKDHLGNVRTVISDAKLIEDIGSTANLIDNDDNFIPEVRSFNDYYPFGMTMPGRQFNSGDYRFGFNGQEKDDEIAGEGNSLDYGERIYDPRIARWLSTDPLQKKYAGLNPYHFTFNSPIAFKDEDGRDGRLAIDYDKKQITLESTIYIYGGDKNIDYKQLAAKYNEAYKNINNSKIVKAANGEEWTVTVNVKFVYDETLDNNMAAMGINSSDQITTGTTEQIRDGSGLKPGDNTLKVSFTADLGNNEGIASQGYNEAQMVGTDPLTGIHESLHLMGYDDRYDVPTGGSMYSGNIMNAGNFGGMLPAFGDYHFADLLDYALQASGGQSGTIVLGESTTPAAPSTIIKGTNGEPDTEITNGETKSSNLLIDNVNPRSSQQRDADMKKSDRVKDKPKAAVKK